MIDFVNKKLNYLSEESLIKDSLRKFQNEQSEFNRKFGKGFVDYVKSKTIKDIYLGDIHKHIQNIDGVDISTYLGAGRNYYTCVDELRESLIASIESKSCKSVGYASSYKFSYFCDNSHKHLYHGGMYLTEYFDITILKEREKDDSLEAIINVYYGDRKYNKGDSEYSHHVIVDRVQLNNHLNNIYK